MSEDHLAANRRSLQRLRDLVARLDADALGRPMGAHWKVAVGMYHLAYWDRFVAQRWRHAANVGAMSPVALESHVGELMNDALTPIWLTMPPELAGPQALAAAEEGDALVERLSAEAVVDARAAGRPKLVERWHHRDQHLDEIERTVSAAGASKLGDRAQAE